MIWETRRVRQSTLKKLVYEPSNIETLRPIIKLSYQLSLIVKSFENASLHTPCTLLSRRPLHLKSEDPTGAIDHGYLLRRQCRHEEPTLVHRLKQLLLLCLLSLHHLPSHSRPPLPQHQNPKLPPPPPQPLHPPRKASMQSQSLPSTSNPTSSPFSLNSNPKLTTAPDSQLRTFGPKGSWALVTGASDGLGLEFATQLTRQDFNLVLASRTASKLDTLARSLEAARPGLQTRTLAIDFSRATPQDYGRLEALVAGLDVAVLVNNVGRSHDMPVPFAQTPAEEVAAIVEINCAATLRVTALVLPGMLERRRGLVLTMGSFAGLVSTPLLATYGGSKAFLQHWSGALAAEVAPYGVTVELVQSYLITSAMSKIRRPSAMIPTARAFVRAVLGKVGRSGGAQGYANTSTPYWSHGIMQWFLGTFTGFTGSFVRARNKVMHEAIQKRALKKREGKKTA